MHETIVIGAGVAGLSFARCWSAGGRPLPLILEKSRGVGGRCATRRVEGQPVDHGLSFLHGSDPGFIDACRDAGSAVEGWPMSVHGAGRACEPRAFRERERRFVFREGLSSFPKSLAHGLEIRLGTRVTKLELDSESVRIDTEAGERIESRDVVLALPLEQARSLLGTTRALDEELVAVQRLLGMMSSEPCLTLLAGYPLDAPAPEWDMCYPEASEALTLVSHDSSKRTSKDFHVLVYQATARFSRQHLEDEPETWSARLLSEASRHLGDWCRSPLWSQTHRWRYARVAHPSCLSQPVRIVLPGGARIGLAGEALVPGGGIEGAFLSGRALARRMLGERET